MLALQILAVRVRDDIGRETVDLVVHVEIEWHVRLLPVGSSRMMAAAYRTGPMVVNEQAVGRAA
jgi:hypothetical protein